jgi:hypothetical protein
MSKEHLPQAWHDHCCWKGMSMMDDDSGIQWTDCVHQRENMQYSWDIHSRRKSIRRRRSSLTWQPNRRELHMRPNCGQGTMHVVPQSLWCYDPLTLRYMTSQQNIQYPKPAHLMKWHDSKLKVKLTFEDFWFATFFHETHLIHMTTSEESLRVLFFTHSLAIDLVH